MTLPPDHSPSNDRFTTFYCPHCDRPVETPLQCGDCGSLICRECGAPLEQADDLGIG